MNKVKEAIKTAYSKTSNVVKTHWKRIIVIVVVLILAITAGFLGYTKYNDNKRIDNLNSDISGLNQKVTDANTKITSISEALAQTEEGKKQLETINSTLEEDKTKLTEDNQNLNAKVSSVEAQLAAKQSELAKTQANLNQKNAELANANKCVNLFKTVQTQFDSFNANINKAQSYYDQAFNATTYEEFERLMNLGDQAYKAAEANYNSIEVSINKFKTGKC